MPTLRARALIPATTAALLALPALAAAETPRGRYIEIDPSMADVVDPAAVSTRLIYLNGCFESGDCQVTFGREDSSNNRSSIASGTLDAFEYGPMVWDAVVACVKETYAPFDVEITDQDPGATPHWENMVGGHSTQIGMDQNTLGVSPWRSCDVIDRSITFTFANMGYFGGRVDYICSVIAQETAHSFGLEHEFLCGDPMTYLEDCSDRKYFNNVDSDCGETAPKACSCGGRTQNSFEELTALFGPGEVATPNLVIEQPADGATVDKGFVINAELGDGVPVHSVVFEINGQVIDEVESAPYAISVPLSLSDGLMNVVVRTTNVYGQSASQEITVTQGAPCGEASDCGGGETCVDGRCVLGPGQPGGLGEACESSDACASSLCATSDEGSFCGEECELGAGGCPDGFGCLDVGGSGLCWKGADEGGCAAGGGGALAPAGLLVALGLLVARRRRRA